MFRWEYGGWHWDLHCQPWLGEEIQRSIDWFNANLDCPERLAPRARRRRGNHGVCWFRAEAMRHVAEARHLAWLITGAGYPVRQIRCHHPGEIVWRDDHQIVAVPNCSGPVIRH